jgi:hypothetical protein
LALGPQVVLHLVGPHVYAPHELGTSPHAPVPVQVLVWVSMPPEQVFSPQGVEAVG